MPEVGSTLVFQESGKHQSRSLKHRLLNSEMDSVSHAGAGKSKTHPESVLMAQTIVQRHLF